MALLLQQVGAVQALVITCAWLYKISLCICSNSSVPTSGRGSIIYLFCIPDFHQAEDTVLRIEEHQSHPTLCYRYDQPPLDGQSGSGSVAGPSLLNRLR